MTPSHREAIERLVLTSLQEEGISAPNSKRERNQWPLFGPGASLKSFALVAFLVGVEQRLADELGIEVSLMDERAMSQTRSPFRNIGTLVTYIERLIQESDG